MESGCKYRVGEKTKKVLHSVMLAGLVALGGMTITRLYNESSSQSVHSAKILAQKCHDNHSQCAEFIPDIVSIFKEESTRQQEENLTNSVFHPEISAIRNMFTQIYWHGVRYEYPLVEESDFNISRHPRNNCFSSLPEIVPKKDDSYFAW